MAYLANIAIASWDVLAQMAPYLLFGFFMAGILSVFVSAQWVERHLGGRGFGPVVKSALFGVPMPLCSCGVIPVGASIHQRGASRAATTAFLLSTPQTGVDSILATYALLGPVFAIFRPLAALITGVVGGGLVAWFDRATAEKPAAGQSGTASCAAGCGLEAGHGNAVRCALRYGFVTLPGDIAKALLVGVAVAGLITAFIQKDSLAPYLGGGMGAMIAMMLFGLPIYVCSTASIPIALGFMHLGASPGAALAFLITGPATNAAAISVFWRILGRRTTVIYLLTVALGALVAGFSLDAVYAYLSEAGSPVAMHAHGAARSWLGDACAVALLGVLIGSLLAKARGTATAVADAEKPTARPMQKVLLKVTGMHCSHCANAVAQSLRDVPGVDQVDVSLDKGEALIIGEDLHAELLTRAVQGLGYEGALLQE